MELGRKGNIGFMEAIAGTMTVCIVMLAFLGFLSSEFYNDNIERTEGFDWNYLPDFTMESGGYVVSGEESLQSFLERSGIRGVTVKVSTCSPDRAVEQTVSAGEESETSVKEYKAIKVRSDKNEYIPTVAEVTLFI